MLRMIKKIDVAFFSPLSVAIFIQSMSPLLSVGLLLSTLIDRELQKHEWDHARHGPGSCCL